MREYGLSFLASNDADFERVKPVAGNCARDWLQLGPGAASGDFSLWL